MPSKTSCCLCRTTNNSFKSLYDDYGQQNGIYEIAVQYFPTVLLQNERYSTVICIECWKHIIAFNRFQQTIINTQNQLEKINMNPILLINKLEDQLDIEKLDQICDYIDGIYVVKDVNDIAERIDVQIFDEINLDLDLESLKDPERKVSYKCDLCPATFDLNFLLNRHYLQRHTALNGHDHKCEICGKSFAQSHTLRKHFAAKHKGQSLPLLFCPQCNRMFKYRVSLDKHMEQVHAKVIEVQQSNLKLDSMEFDNEMPALILEKPLETENPKNLEINTDFSIDVYNSNIKNESGSNKDPPILQPNMIYHHDRKNNKESQKYQSNYNLDIIANVALKHIETYRPEDLIIEECSTEIDEQPIDNTNFYNTVTNSESKDNSAILLNAGSSLNQIQTPALNIKPEVILGGNNFDVEQTFCNDVQEGCIQDDNDDFMQHDIETNNDMIDDDDDFTAKTCNISRKDKELKYDHFIAKWKENLECPLCNQNFKNFLELTQHFQQDHPEQKCFIKCCQLKLVNRYKIYEHLRYHNDPKAYQCDVCKKCFKTAGSVVHHKQFTHIEKELSNNCYLCQCKVSKDLYAKHLENQVNPSTSETISRDFLNEKFYKTVCCRLKQRILRKDKVVAKWNNDLKCLICEKKFPYYSLIRDHFCHKHPGDNFYIDCCKRKFFKLEELLEHIRLHLDPSKRKSVNKNLNEMETDFEEQVNDETHIIESESNEDVDAYIAKWKGDLECVICKDNFSTFGLLSKHFSLKHPHLKSHVVCCERVLSKRCFLYDHLRKYHNNINIHSCKICKATFSQYSKLRRHYLQIHDPNDRLPFKCEACGMGFNQNRFLKRHMLSKHTEQNPQKYVCQQCNRMFKYRISLERHRQQEHSEQNFNNFQEEQPNATRAENSEIFNNTAVQTEYTIYQVNETVPNTECNKLVGTESKTFDNSEISKQSEEDHDDSDDDEDIFTKASKVCDAEKYLLYDDFIAKHKGDLECSICNMTIGNFGLLSQHFNSEHPEEICHIKCCQIIIHKRANIVDHLRTHLNPNVFQCNICQQNFRGARHLTAHKLKKHSNLPKSTRIYLCHCKKALQLYAQEEELNTNPSTSKDPSSLNIQYDTVVCCQRKQKILDDDALIAKWKSVLDCRICKATFSYFSLMRLHFEYEHPQEKCYVICCQRNFYKMLDATEHIRLHLDPFAFKCDICNIPLSGKSSLTRHMREKHDDTVANQKWSCQQCNKSFKQRYTLTKHIRVDHPADV